MPQRSAPVTPPRPRATRARGPSLLALLVALGTGPAIAADPAVAPTPSDPLLVQAGVRQGLCVVVGANDAGRLTALTNDGWILVQGIQRDAATSERVRAELVAAGRNGIASVLQVQSTRTLPYNDHIVSLLVVDADALGSETPPETEILRVITPATGVALVRTGGAWAKRSRSLPATMDDWTHLHHDASNNPVSEDEEVGEMKGLQWLACMEGGARSSFGLILSGGRWFHPYGPQRDGVGESGIENLDNRDAFNGMLLWRRVNGAPSQRVRKEASISADGRRLYGNLQRVGPALALDLRTGAQTASYDAGSARPEYGRFPTSPLPPFINQVVGDRLVQGMLENIRVFDTTRDALAWSAMDPVPGQFVQQIAADERVVVAAFSSQRTTPAYGYGHAHIAIDTLVAWELASGRELWRTADYTGYQTANLVLYRDVLVFEHLRRVTGKSEVILVAQLTLDAATGKLRRRNEQVPEYKLASALHGTFGVIADEFEGQWFDGGPARINVFTGVRGIQPATDRYNWCGFTRWTAKGTLPHASCWVDRATNTVSANFTARTVCDMGRFPGYGQVYYTHGACGCIPRLFGFASLHARTTAPAPLPDTARLVKGAGVAGPKPTTWPAPGSWPMHMGDARRSSSTPVDLPARLALVATATPAHGHPASPIGVEWEENQSVLGPVSPPVAAEGVIAVAVTDRHRLDVYDGRTLTLRWSYTVGARIDSPPVLYAGMAIFGARDGWVYAVALADGRLVWRACIAPAERHLVVSSGVESLWPVAGSLMLLDGRLVATAGRQNEIDGGIALAILDPLTGATLVRRMMGAQLASDDRQPRNPAPDNARVFTNDVMTSDGQLAYMNSVAIHPPTGNWVVNFRNWGGTAEFPAGVTGFGPEYGGSHAMTQINGLTSRNIKPSSGPKAGSGWYYGRQAKPYKNIMGHRFVVRPGRLYNMTRREPGASLTLRTYALDAAGNAILPDGSFLPTTGDEQTAKYGEAIQVPFPMTRADTFIGIGERWLLVGEKNGKGVATILGADWKLQQEIALPGIAVPYGAAVADGRVAITLRDGRVVLLADAGGGNRAPNQGGATAQPDRLVLP